MPTKDRNALIKGPNIMLFCLKLGFVLTLTGLYFFENEQSAGWRASFVLGSGIAFIVVHWYYWRMKTRSLLYPVLLLDFLTSASYGYVFIRSDFPDHLFLGVTALSVFLNLDRTRTLVIVWSGLLVVYLLPLFAMEWLMIYDFNPFRYFDNGLFILFASIVGSLLRSYQTNRTHMMKLYSELQQSHATLKEFAMKAEELAAARERVRISREIHDVVGHKLSALIVQLQVGRKLYERDPSRSLHVYRESEELARSALHEIRLSVKAVRDEPEISSSLIEAIHELSDEFSRLTTVNIELRAKGTEIPLPKQLILTACRIVQETLTNALKHGNARHIAVDLTYLESGFALRVQNDGVVMADFKQGFGLINLQERVFERNGTVLFQTSPDEGFAVDVYLPYPAFADANERGGQS